MAEYIELVAAMSVPVLPKEYRKYQTSNLDDAYEQGWDDALENLKNLKKILATDVAPVKHGRWVKDTWPSGTHKLICSECGEWGSKRSNYCPNCGAKMDVEE